jgi:hypothetical protein
MSDILILSVNVSGENIMSNPLLKAHGFYREKGKEGTIEIEMPITSIKQGRAKLYGKHNESI